MSTFIKFRDAVNEKFKKMTKNAVPLKVNISDDLIWNTYLEAFPEGTNEIFRERREYDCNCCKQFVRTVGKVVTITNGKLSTVWDVNLGDTTFQIVADKMKELILSHNIEKVFTFPEKLVSKKSNIDLDMSKYDHFYADVSRTAFLYYKEGTYKTLQTDAGVFKRSLTEISLSSLEIALELINQDSIYRGSEHKESVKKFLNLKTSFDDSSDKDLWLWENVLKTHSSLLRFKNTVIGTLICDISEGKDLESAVASFESKVAPSNYKRTKSVVTKSMINSAKKKIEELGYIDSLQRRYATEADLDINNVIFTKSVDKEINATVFDTLGASLDKKSDIREFKKITEISIEDFIKKVVPTAKNMEVLLENKNTSNLVSLVTSKYDDVPSMFKWDNPVSWSYNGGLTDSSIADKVNKAGGSTKGDLRISLSWNNTDDYDIHIKDKKGNSRIYHGTKTAIGGFLDVDMNVQGESTEPVENVIFKNKKNIPKNTEFTVVVNNFKQRNNTDYGFTIEVDNEGVVTHYSFEDLLSHTKDKKVLTFMYDGDKIHIKTVHNNIKTTGMTREVWGLETNSYHTVTNFLTSPNHWGDNCSGNKHYMFMLEGCQNDTEARPFYNEFLKDELNDVRKAMDLVGASMELETCENQLSGLGFSSTIKNELIVRVTGKSKRLFKVKF